MSLSIEDIVPENDPTGEPTALKVYTRDGGEKRKKLAAVIPTKLPEN